MGKNRKSKQRYEFSNPLHIPSSNSSNAKQKMSQFPSSSVNARQWPASYSSADLNNHNFNMQGGPFINEVSLSHPLDPRPFPSNNGAFTGNLHRNSLSNLGDSTNPFNSDFSPQMINQSEQMEMMRAEIIELQRKLNSMEDTQNRVKPRNASMEAGRNLLEDRDFMCMENLESRPQNRNLSMKESQNRPQNRNLSNNAQNSLQNTNSMPMKDLENSLQDRNLSIEDPQSTIQMQNFTSVEPTSLAQLLKDVPYVSPFSQHSKAEKKLEAYYDSMPVPVSNGNKTNVLNNPATSKLSNTTAMKSASKVLKEPPTSKYIPAKASNKPASSNIPTKANNEPGFSNNIPTKTSNKHNSNPFLLIPGVTKTKARKLLKKHKNYKKRVQRNRSRANKLAIASNSFVKTNLKSGPLPLTQFSSELGITNTSSGQPNNWIRGNIHDDGLFPTPRLDQGNNSRQNRFQANPHQSTSTLTGKTYQRDISEASHFSRLQNPTFFRNDADLDIELLQLKQQNVEDQLSELDRRSQEMEHSLSLPQNEDFLEF